MKKLMIALSLAAVFSGSVMAQEVTDDSISAEIPDRVVDYDKKLITQGNVTFTGEIFANTCSIKDGADKTIPLKKVSNTIFSNGKYEEEVGNFVISLENCSPNEGRSVSLSFSADQKNVTEDGYLTNISEDKFKSNILVKLTHNGKLIDFKTNRPEDQIVDSADVSISQNSAGNELPLDFKVFYVKDAKQNIVTAGKVVATAQYQITYK